MGIGLPYGVSAYPYDGPRPPHFEGTSMVTPKTIVLLSSSAM